MLHDVLYDPRTPYITAVFVFYLLFAVLVLRRFVRPFALVLLGALTAVAFVIIILGEDTMPAWGGDKTYWFRKWLCSISGEYNLLATFSSLQLLLVVGAALTLAIWTRPGKWWVRLYWAWIALVFAGLTYDEYFQWHEAHRDIWEIVYGAIGLSILLSTALVYQYGMRRANLPVFVFVLGGIGMLASGGMFFEKDAVDKRVIPASWDTFYRSLPYIEEVFEVLGVSLVLVVLLSFAANEIPAPHRGKARLTFLVSSTLLITAMLASFWVLPRIEARYWADRVEVRYEDGALSLVGYHASDTVFSPGDRVTVDFFWRAVTWQPRNFGMSALLLTYPDGLPVVKKDVAIVDPPPGGWVPGFVYKEPVTLTIPADVVTPSSLLIAVSIWDESDKHFTPLDITQTDAQMLTPQVAALGRVAVVSGQKLPAPPTAIEARFDAGFKLTGYSLPADVDDTLTVAFWWSSGADVDQNLVQLFHLIPVEGGDSFVFDQPPFGGRFPTDNWDAGVRVMDTWTLALPDDMPAGEYRVVTGMYDLNSASRDRVTDRKGRVFQDDLVELGIIHKQD